MNYIAKLKELRETAIYPPGFWPDPNDAEAELRQVLSKSLDLWLELAEAAQRLEDNRKNYGPEGIINCDYDLFEIESALAKLKGET